MDVLVLGTSNCIISDSFIKYFEKFAGYRIENRSIGASSNSVGLYILETLKDRKFDFAILDYEINDTGVLGRGLKTADDIRENIRSIVAITRSMGCTPILTIIPSYGTLQNVSEVERAHLDVCRQEGVHFLNVADLFREALKQGLTTRDALMRDSAHMSARVTPLIGEVLAKGLQNILATAAEPKNHRTAVRKMRSIPAAAVFAPQALIERRSSIYSSHYGRLRQGETIRLPVREDECLLALVMNTGALGANVAFRNGREEVVKPLIVYWDENKPDWFTAICVDFKRQLPGGHNGIEITALGPDAQPTEATLHQKPFLPGRYGEVEIEGFLIGTQAKLEVTSEVQSRPGLPLSLLEMTGQQRTLERLSALTPLPS
ncbi:SGNH/GDSL hydrolase family protein [Roseomonas sp. E05]|uniref:SGNH/GDSL hydrolase family protein n=1 Tax=Roseomonas sp. E05 TaxID=3046310 RepID=UPI0024B87885|nr:SGNH/GDSL hydrolase family protein [Roseomonas sp. E05]MDJ0390422.1 SGNH/GDSL hydrolase family protein [Roseomonas sp. E05]